MERKLATIRKIDKLEPIPGADLIQRATVGGWELVTAKDNGFKEGDYVVYLEIDSWVPHEIAPFLSKGKEPREYNGVKGERLRTVKLRGQVSQGLILPESILDNKKLFEVYGCTAEELFSGVMGSPENYDLTELLGIQKWEKPVPAQLAGQTKRYFPSFLRKTDQERIQNLTREIEEVYNTGEKFEVTLKLDGSSMTVYRNETEEETEFGVCSRNLELKLDQEGNSFVDMANECGILSALETIEGSYAVQGELFGEGIQDNPHGLKGRHFHIFDIFDIKEQRYLTRPERIKFYQNKLLGSKYLDLNLCRHVDVLHEDYVLETDNVKFYLEMAEGKLGSGREREGIVFKSLERDFSFKAISNKYLLKGGS